jgi:hypothetical protein
MRWGNRSYQSRFYFSEKEIDFTNEYLDYSQFLLQEFFTADLETRKKLTDYYSDIYGPRSLNYLKSKYSQWAKGNYHLTDLIKERILDLMPECLNENAKYKLGIHQFMASIKNNIKSYQSNQNATFGNFKNINHPEEVVTIFEKELQKIQSLKVLKSKFNILSGEEQEEALLISRFILETKLQKAFNQIERDFNIFLPFMSKFERGVYSATYIIKSFKLKVSIANSKSEFLVFPKFSIKGIEANSRFKQFSDKYLAYELVSTHQETLRAERNSFLNENDIALFFTQYKELLNGDESVKMNSEYQGQGGILSLDVQIKPLKLLKISILISSVKILFFCFSLVFLILVAINWRAYWTLFFGGLVTLSFSLEFLDTQIKKLKSFIHDHKIYGK